MMQEATIWKRRPYVGCVAMGSALLCILRSRLLLYSAGSGVQVVLSRQFFKCK